MWLNEKFVLYLAPVSKKASFPFVEQDTLVQSTLELNN